MNILLTGGSGFLGSALTRKLMTQGHRVYLLLRQSSELKRLADVEYSLNVRRYESYKEISRTITEASPDVVIHAACSYGRKKETDLALLETNLIFGAKILQFLSETDQSVTFLNVGTALPYSMNSYTLSKQLFSQWGRALAKKREGNIRFTNVILQTIYGEGDDPSKFTSMLIEACRLNKETFRLTEGMQRRDWIYIDDVVDAFIVILENVNKLGAQGDLEVGTGKDITLREFSENVKTLTQSRTKLLFGAVPYRENEPMFCRADPSALFELGWRPLFDVKSGLRRTLERENLR